MKVSTFYDLGLPSIGHISLQEMAEHRNPMVVALAKFLETKGKYLPEDRFDVKFLLHLASFVEPMGGGKRYDFSKIRIGLGGGSSSFRPTQAGTTNSTQNNPWQIAFLRERSRAVEAIAVKRLGMSEGKRALAHMLVQSHIFQLD
ncbi:MAG: hypothetical protein U5J83_10890 [Bryobacterales bacterium]|nr:hypothetical protein [Bryobacterales bacterium]